MKWLAIYLIIGLVMGIIIDRFYEMDEDDTPLSYSLSSLSYVLLWPLLIGGGLLCAIFGIDLEEEDDEYRF